MTGALSKNPASISVKRGLVSLGVRKFMNIQTKVITIHAMAAMPKLLMINITISFKGVLSTRSMTFNACFA